MITLPAGARTWTTHPRDGWAPGPWDGEPDKISWTDAATGRPCLIVRSPMGALCGYVAVDPGHPLHGVDEDLPDLVVHGGITYTDRCQPTESEAEGVCHIPEPGRPEDVWWLGFDCGHFDDLMPGLLADIASTRRSIGLFADLARTGRSPRLFGGSTYRPVSYVVAQVEALARQLVDAAPAAAGGVS